MTWKASLVLVALVVACSDSSNGSGGDAGNGGGGAGGEGGAAGAGGEGGAGGEVDPGLGELLPCDDIVRSSHTREEYATFPTTPGEVIYVAHCDHYQIRDNFLVEDPPQLPPGCDINRWVAEGDVSTGLCREIFFGDLVQDHADYYQEHGWKRVYLRREPAPPPPASEFGELLVCDDIRRSSSRREEHALIQTTPGEVLHITDCDHYFIRDGVLMEEWTAPPGCSTYTTVAEGDTYTRFCRELIFGAPKGFPPDTDFEDYDEHGWKRVYLRRE